MVGMSIKSMRDVRSELRRWLIVVKFVDIRYSESDALCVGGCLVGGEEKPKSAMLFSM